MDGFNILIYKLANNDLYHLTNNDLERHYNMHGKYENRICNIINFDINHYRNNNDDLKILEEKLKNNVIINYEINIYHSDGTVIVVQKQ